MTTQASATAGFALSPQQAAAWRDLQGGVSRSVFAVVAVTGATTSDAIARAIGSVADRQEILRTSIRRVSGMQLPLQSIGDAAAVEIAQVSAIGRATVDDAIRAARVQSFDINGDALARFTIIECAREEHLLCIAASSFVFDAASVAIVVSEICSLASESSQILNEEPLQYADFAAWQEGMLDPTDPATAAALDHWQRVSQLSSTLPRSTDEGSAARAVAAVAVQITPKVASAIGSTDAVTQALAAWCILLARMSGRSDAVIGVETDGRSLDDLHGALGPIARTLPVQVEIEGRDFQEVTEHASAGVRGAIALGEYLPVADPAAAVAARFAVVDCTTQHAGALSFRVRALEVNPAEFEVRLRVDLTDDGADLFIDFDPGRIARAVAEDAAESLAATLCAAIDAPRTQAATLPLLSARQRDAVLHAADNTPEVDVAATKSVPEMVAAVARLRTDEIAVMSAEGSLTFGDLTRRIEGVAAMLMDAGVETEDVVAVCMGRSALLPAAMLGVLRAGATLLPIDASYPAERVRFMLADSGARVALCDEVGSRALSGTSVEVARIETTSGDAAARLRVAAKDAYVVYTSGTTGTPRGIAVRHSALSQYVGVIGDALQIGDDDVYMHTASIAFSSTVRQVLAPLARGASVVIATEDERRDPAALLETVRRRGVTAIDLVPSYLRALVRHVRGAASTDRSDIFGTRLRLIASASEALYSDIPRAIREEAGYTGRVVNMYGLTETTGIVCTHEITQADLEGAARVVPIGRPLAGLRARVVDTSLEPVPFDVAGELVIEGASIGASYAHDATLTAERFGRDDSTSSVARVAFRTGDRVRLRRDGTLEFVGRSDDTVKVRGARIALGEIEVALARCPLVREAAVAAREIRGETQLVGYVIVADGHAFDEHAIRDYAGSVIPTHMIPAQLVPIDAFPLNQNGKLDRAALPDPATLARRTKGIAPPRDMVEDALVGMWAEVLELDEVGIDDDFFEIGGHSLIATQLVSRVRETFQVPITLRSLFESRTVAAQALAVRSLEQSPGVAEKIAGVVVRIRAMGPDAARELLAQKTC